MGTYRCTNAVASPELFVEKLSAEISPDRIGMDDIFLLYGVSNLEKMVSLTLLPREVLARKLEIDLSAPVQPRPLIKRLNDYGKFLIDTVRLDADVLSQSLLRCALLSPESGSMRLTVGKVTRSRFRCVSKISCRTAHVV
jgi:hypothetical protein